MSIHKLSENFSVTGQVSQANMIQIAQMGFKSVICNRPDGEGMMQPSFSKIEKAAIDAGLAIKYLPVSPASPQVSDAQSLASMLAELESPVLAYCASGARAANLWNMCETIRRSARSAA